MNICFLVSGIPRSFYKHLHNYFIKLYQLDLNFHVYINFAEELSDNIYSNKKFDVKRLNNYSFYKSIIITPTIQYKNRMNKKDINILNQWYRLEQLFKSIDINYDYYIRLRPDIDILMEPNDFINIVKNCLETYISIPNGYDFHNGYKLSNESNTCINDQIAIMNKENMSLYSNFYNTIINKYNINSENELYTYLINNKININRIILPYKIILSECKVISIAGDSGSGKSTLANALESILFDSSLTIETDRYHKWERESTKWNNYTHLHPEANYLEKMSEDVFRLKLGETIFSVDYDHTSGKFTEPQKIESKPFILLCGLHTLYEKNIRDISEIKIFLDTNSDLKIDWKIKRDVKERGHTIEKILNSIESRKSDYDKYINPQKLLSNIIIEYNYDIPILHITNEFNYYVNQFLSQISTNTIKKYDSFNQYIINKSKINNELISIFIKNKEIFSKLKEYPFNIIQTIIYLCLFND